MKAILMPEKRLYFQFILMKGRMHFIDFLCWACSTPLFFYNSDIKAALSQWLLCVISRPDPFY
jgi:hypothetical protein